LSPPNAPVSSIIRSSLGDDNEYPIGQLSVIPFRKNSENIHESPGDEDQPPNKGEEMKSGGQSYNNNTFKISMNAVPAEPKGHAARNLENFAHDDNYLNPKHKLKKD